jgi:hypothetical protein
MTKKLPAPVARLLESANANDVDAFLAGFVDDGVVDDSGREFVGKAAIRAWSDAEFIGRQVTLSVADFVQDGEATTITANVGGNGFNGPSHFSFTTAGNKVARMTIQA